MKKIGLILAISILLGTSGWAQTEELKERKAYPKEGLKAFYKFIIRNVRYPQEAKKAGVKGVVLVECVIEKNGALTVASIKKSLGHGCDEEAVRVLRKSPAWLPAIKDHKLIKSKAYIPIRFNLH